MSVAVKILRSAPVLIAQQGVQLFSCTHRQHGFAIDLLSFTKLLLVLLFDF